MFLNFDVDPRAEISEFFPCSVHFCALIVWHPETLCCFLEFIILVFVNHLFEQGWVACYMFSVHLLVNNCQISCDNTLLTSKKAIILDCVSCTFWHNQLWNVKGTQHVLAIIYLYNSTDETQIHTYILVISHKVQT